ncbi:hypothetical protein ACFQZZ_21415 [Nocardia sp. GCM10030253]|uniref:hypothetical protein n=1 Tax=Nocardia sp. GCM10030253 TaxID=3273404 RepID=UPI003627623F
MVARSVVALGVSTERGAVHAVALADSGERLPERVLLHRVVKTDGDSKADLAAAVETAMDFLAAELGPDLEIGGAAVTYRDAAERRAIVTRLASGQWDTASLVSAKAAHLNVAGVMTWLNEFDDLLICEVVPGHQAFTLIDRRRTRVLAANSQTGSAATAEAMGAAVTAAWDQFEADAVRPDAVVLIGSGARAAAVVAAADGFGAPVIPCKIAASASAVGAALSAMADLNAVGEPVEPVRHGRGTATALFAAASVLAGGLVVGGVYLAGGISRPATGAVVADARVTADARVVDAETGSSSGSNAGSAVEPGVFNPRDSAIEGRGVAAGELRLEPTVVVLDVPQYSAQRWGSGGQQDRPLPLVQSEPVRETESAAQMLPGTGIPASTTKVGAPNGSLLFPGEGPPPAAGTPESYHWWDNHFRMLMQWASQQLLST